MDPGTAQGYEWKIGQEDDGTWTVIDFNGGSHSFVNESDARAYIDRDKRMFAKHTKAVWDEMTRGQESAADEEVENSEGAAPPPPPLNRADRRRVQRLAGRHPSSARTRTSHKRKGF